MNCRSRKAHGLTAIEVAIIVVILAVLAILGAQFYLNGYVVRKRVEQSRAHLADLAKAIEARYVDYSMYPVPMEYVRSPEQYANERAPSSLSDAARDVWKDYEETVRALDEAPDTTIFGPRAIWPGSITTPVAYVKTLPVDPFSPGPDRSYRYMLYRGGDFPVSWILAGCGPDGDYDLPIYDFGREIGRMEKSPRDPLGYHGFPRPVITYQYDPTNGLRSDGDLIRMAK